MIDNEIHFSLLSNLLGLLLISSIVSWIIFATVSMRPIERKLRADNKDIISKWDGPGWRVIWYAWAIFLPICNINNSKDPLLNPVEVKKYVTRKDWLLAAWVFISIYGMILCVLISYINTKFI
jgi:hypothetical protein